MTSPALIRAAPLLFVLLWSSGFVGAKYGLPYAAPLPFLTLRFLLVLALMLPLVLIARAPWPRDARAIAHVCVAGLLLQAGYLVGVFTAVHHGLSAGGVALVVGLQPVLTGLGARLLGETVAPRQWAGLLLGLAGVVLVVGPHAPGGGVSTAQLLPALAALASITLGTLYQKRYTPHFDLRTGAVLQFLPSALITAAAMPVAGQSWQFAWSPAFLLALGWLVLGLSIGAISLLHLLLRHGSAVGVASLFYLTPAVTALMGWIAFGEHLGRTGFAGMALAALGVWLSTGQNRGATAPPRSGGR